MGWTSLWWLAPGLAFSLGGIAAAFFFFRRSLRLLLLVVLPLAAKVGVLFLFRLDPALSKAFMGYSFYLHPIILVMLASAAFAGRDQQPV